VADFKNPNQGITVLDGFGGIHELGDIFRFTDFNGDAVVDAAETAQLPLFPYFAGKDVYRDIEVFIADAGTANQRIGAVLIATGDGRVFAVQFNQTGQRVVVRRNYLPSLGVTFPTNDVLRDVEFTTDGKGYFALLSDGSIVSANESGVLKLFRFRPSGNNTGIDVRSNPAVDLEIVSGTDTNVLPVGYILDAKGQIHSVGGAVPLAGPVSNAPIYVDMELYGNGAVIADGFGRFFTVVPQGSPDLDIVLPVLGFGLAEPALIDFEIQIDPTVSFYNGVGILALTKFGTLHTSGAMDYILTDEGVARRMNLMDKPEGQYPRIDRTEHGLPYINMGVLFDIMRGLVVYQFNPQ